MFNKLEADDGTHLVAMAVAVVYGIIMGSAGTLFVQWLHA